MINPIMYSRNQSLLLLLSPVEMQFMIDYNSSVIKINCVHVNVIKWVSFQIKKISNSCYTKREQKQNVISRLISKTWSMTSLSWLEFKNKTWLHHVVLTQDDYHVLMWLWHLLEEHLQFRIWNCLKW